MFVDIYMYIEYSRLKIQIMALIYGKQKVTDFAVWHPIFNEDNDRREAASAKLVSLSQSVADPNEVHFVFDVADMGSFMTLLQSPEMQETMMRAGATEKPAIFSMEEMHA